jgi:hypothetical protein
MIGQGGGVMEMEENGSDNADGSAFGGPSVSKPKDFERFAKQRRRIVLKLWRSERGI